MAGYVKRIALIKTLSAGYSADGGELKGIVRCEAYAGFLKAEASLINFAPVTEGEYRLGITDGQSVVVFGAPAYEGECSFDPSDGFACLICFCRSGSVLPVASAVCGDNQKLLPSVQSAMERGEEQPKAAYDDEAIAESNYYELEADENGGAVRPPEEEQKGSRSLQDEESAGTFPRPKEQSQNFPVREETAAQGDGVKCATSSFRIGGTPEDEQGNTQAEGEERGGGCSAESNGADDGEAAEPRLADGGFYERMSGDIKKIFAAYPRLAALEDVIENSRWAKISYGNGAHYAFGVIYDGGNAKYLCYAVPVAADAPCPESLKGRAGYIPVDGGGYWVMYQDAQTGISLTVG